MQNNTRIPVPGKGRGLAADCAQIPRVPSSHDLRFPLRSGEEGSGETAPGPTRAGKRRRWHRPQPRPPRGTPEGAQDAVGGMGAAIVGTQRRAERTAATGGRRDHQSRFPPQRGSRAGRRLTNAELCLGQWAGTSTEWPNGTGARAPRPAHPAHPAFARGLGALAARGCQFSADALA